MTDKEEARGLVLEGKLREWPENSINLLVLLVKPLKQ